VNTTFNKLAAVGIALVTLMPAVGLVGAQSAVPQLPPEVREQLEKQRDALKLFYIEYDDSVVSNGRTFPVRKYTAYFDGNRFTVKINGGSMNEYAFDGKFLWDGNEPVAGKSRVFSKSLASSSDDPNVLFGWFWRISYCDGASLFMPTYCSGLPEYTSLEPMALRDLEKSDSAKIEREGANLRITVNVEDAILSNWHNADLERYRRNLAAGNNPPEYISREMETVKRMQAMIPKRKISMLLDSQHGYSVSEREEWTYDGRRIARVEAKDWKYYENVGIWLPQECIVSSYATPMTFAEFWDNPQHIRTIVLKAAEFGKKDIEFALSNRPEYKVGGTTFTDRTLPEVREHDYTQLVAYTISANGDLLRRSALFVLDNTKKGHQRQIIWKIILLALMAVPPGIFVFHYFKNRKQRR